MRIVINESTRDRVLRAEYSDFYVGNTYSSHSFRKVRLLEGSVEFPSQQCNCAIAFLNCAFLILIRKC